MANVTLLHYNNYFNRIVKKEEFYTSYLTSDPNYNKIQNVNFVPGDGITTSLVLGTYSLHMGFDYVVVTEIVNGTETIASRWFLMEEKRTRDGQYEIVLRRDLLVDYLDNIKDAPCFIEKAIIDDKENYLLYNSENYKVNQIKTAESLIKDDGKVAWVVGYISSKMSSGSITGNFGTIQVDNTGHASGTQQLPNSNYTFFYITDVQDTTTYGGFTYSFNARTKILTYTINNSSIANANVVLRYTAAEPATVAGATYSVEMSGSQIRKHLTDAPYDMFCIPYGSIHLQTANIDTTKEAALEIAMEMSKDLGSNLYDIQLLPYCPRRDMLGSEKIYEVIGVEHVDYNYIYQNDAKKSILIWCDKSTFNFLGEGDTELNLVRPIDATERTAQKSYTDSRLSRLSSSSTNASITFYDDAFKTTIVTSITSFTATKDSYSDSISTITGFSQNQVAGSLTVNYTGTSFPWGTQTVNSTLNYKYKNYENPEYLDYKISNECDLYRLTSPNYSGQFEWSIAKSTGNANWFDVDCTYKPYQPYIHLAPRFSRLYGSDFDDARGLICGGDFSLPVTSDAWTEYQIQNKTYQDMFDRQIQHMDRQWELESNRNAITGALGVAQAGIMGGAAGAKAGSAGGPIGAIIGGMLGAAVGTGLSTAGLVADTIYGQESYAENRQFAYDQFNLGLQNVQALPYGLTKVAAYTANNKIFPMVEYYTCSKIERDAFKDKITYNGMSVNVIGKISDYISNSEIRYIKGQIIRLPDFQEDSHMANEIYNEIYKGVYI